MMAFMIVSIFTGLTLAIIGVLIRRYKMVETISGYDPDKVIDKDGLANWTGANLILMGIMAVIIGILSYVMPISNKIIYIGGLVIVIIVLSIRTAIGCRRYEAK